MIINKPYNLKKDLNIILESLIDNLKFVSSEYSLELDFAIYNNSKIPQKILKDNSLIPYITTDLPINSLNKSFIYEFISKFLFDNNIKLDKVEISIKKEFQKITLIKNEEINYSYLQIFVKISK